MIKKLKNDIDTELKAFLKKASADFELKSSSNILYASIINFLIRGGKRIRPILFILSYLGYTKNRKIIQKNLIRASLSFELLHDFLLVHDDIIDESFLRRGKPAMHTLLNQKLNLSPKNKLGANLGIVTGDILFALAVRALLSFNENPLRKENALKIFTEITAYTGIGEFIDVLNNISDINKISKKDINLTYALKTSKYTFEGPLMIGGILSGAPKEEINKLSKLGRVLGLAFQIQDDLLDVFGTVQKTGKPIFSDIAESKKTLLIWQTHKRALKKDKAFIEKVFKKKPKNKQELRKIQHLIKTTGTGEYYKKQVLADVEESISITHSLHMKDKLKTVLKNFINKSYSGISSLDI